MNLKGKDFKEIARKIKKRIRLKFSDGIHIKHVDEIAITPILKCNLNCVMCHQGEIKCTPNMSIEDFVKILKNLKRSNVTKISLVGGEIFVHPKMWEFIKIMEKMGFKYDISSNLFNVPNIEIFKKLRGLEIVTTSLDGDEEIHNKIRRNPQAFQRTSENIKKLLKEGIRVDVACVIQKANFDRLEEFLEMICKMGVKSVTYLIENKISEKEKKDSKNQLKTIIGEDSEIYISSIKNPLGELNEGDYKRIYKKINNLKKISKKCGINLNLPAQLIHPEVLFKKTSLKDYTCSLFKGYNGLIYNDGYFNSCGFVRFIGEHSLLNKTPLQILNSPPYVKKRIFFKKNGALEKCRMCCALMKK